jgi:spore coat protein U-like protein
VHSAEDSGLGRAIRERASRMRSRVTFAYRSTSSRLDHPPSTSHYAVTPVLLSNVTVTIYGRIPARQDVSAGSYTDTVVATINF